MDNQKLLVKNIEVYAENNNIEEGFIKIINNKIEEINSLDRLESEDGYHVFDFSNTKVKAIPGLIDVHIHGANGADVMDGTPEALKVMATALPQEGTTSFLATTMTQSNDNIEKAITNVASYINHQPKGQAEIIGIHLEGPFIHKDRKGAQPVEYIKDPNISVFKKWNRLANQHIRLVTLAPELPGGLEFIQHLKKHGIIASAGHTNATAQEITIAIDHGLSHITHLYNQMRGFHHREPGVVGSAWLHDQLMVEIIADGIHSTSDAVNTAYQLKGNEKMLLITDAMRAKCLQDGNYELGGQKVIVENQKATLEDGTLAGSTLKLGDAVKNIINFTNCSLEEAISMASSNAAKELGIDDKKGTLATGKDADIVLLNENNDIILTICRGEIAYKGE
ncbi:N-acetylglucosamine-6-phosphate deacetylase [Gracilibacillus salitolerans]|uniref:N-acetylglucosamine-6-phosphate deacetylase n=1 Tax=Gracilibacillus salitolerans TaxID=2663022 RepID=A0A5Q2TP43_9BACI|nr:N-acetylglucosamine-6-phosphate deacetylase [Gracilibacillus salitolerans]QGH35803.1 N-acetylglucosamine-6-phosphate deacetylase [Gracilibacillus salitolerans]